MTFELVMPGLEPDDDSFFPFVRFRGRHCYSAGEIDVKVRQLKRAGVPPDPDLVREFKLALEQALRDG